MAIEIMDMDASEVPAEPARTAQSNPAPSRNTMLRRLERELRMREERIARRVAD